MDKKKLNLNEIIKNDKKLMYYIANKYIGSIKDYELEDLVQEVALCFYEAAEYYDESMNVSFKTLAYQASIRKLSNIYRYQNAQKRSPSQVVYFEQEVKESGLTYGDFIKSDKFSVQETENSIDYKEVMEIAKKILNDIEFAILEEYSKGTPIKEIAKKLELNEKTTSNKIYLIKNKLKDKLKV